MRKWLVLVAFALLLLATARNDIVVDTRQIVGGIRLSVVFRMDTFKNGTPWIYESRLIITFKNWEVEEDTNSTLHPKVMNRLAQ